MRKDQPKLKKQFAKLKNQIKLLERKLAHREHVIDYIGQELLEHERRYYAEKVG